ncbi:MAG TPA: P-loop NTPase [Thermoanaerobaculaceae bacterium]|nr:P-loop NTPase [Thermoanaerobaculaceae bacterium]HRS15469.1 P-loop NTPase [Thermoanaerobaculaceae bacterium]
MSGAVPPEAGVPTGAEPRLVAVGGGKGGIGKSVLAALFGIECARRGLSTVLLDCDFGGPNLHSLLGMSHPRETVSDFVFRRTESLAALAVPTPVPGLTLISGPRSATADANLLHQQRIRLKRAIGTLHAQVAVLDLGAGTHYDVVDFFLLASHGVLAVTPEALSVENAYRFLKVAFLRRIRNADLGDDLTRLIGEAARDGSAGARTPAELLAHVARQAPAAGQRLARLMETLRPLLVVNQARTAQDLALCDAMAQAARRLFGVGLQPLGVLHHCETLARTVRARLPVLPENLGPEAVADVGHLVTRLLALPAPGGTR